MRAAAVMFMLAGVACGRVDFVALGDGGTGDGARRDGGGSGGDGGTTMIHFVQSAGNTVGIVTTAQTTPAQPVSVGDLLLVGVSYDQGPSPTVSDTTGTLFYMVGSGEAIPLPMYLFAGFAASTTSETFTVTIPQPPNSYLQIQVWEYSGITHVNTIDDFAVANGTTTATDGAATRALTVSTTNELLFAWVECFVSCHSGTGFTQESNVDGDPAADRIIAAPGSYAATMTLDSGGSLWTIVGATLRGN